MAALCGHRSVQAQGFQAVVPDKPCELQAVCPLHVIDAFHGHEISSCGCLRACRCADSRWPSFFLVALTRPAAAFGGVRATAPW